MIKVKVLKSTIVEGHGIVSAGETIELQLSHAKTLVGLKFADLVNKSDEKELKVKVNEPVDFEKEPKTSEVEKKLEETSDKNVKTEKKPSAKKEVKEVKKGE